MLGPHSQLHIRSAALRLLAAMAFVVFAGCAATPPQQAAAGEEAQDESDADAPAGEAQALAPEQVDRTALPNQDLTENLLYEFLLAEIAGQRGNTALSAQAYVDLAKRTRDPRIARRATEVALYARMNNAAVDAATIWHETEPDSTRPLQALSGLLIAAGRYDEALLDLTKLLAGSASEPGHGVAPLSRTPGLRAPAGCAKTLWRGSSRVPEAHGRRSRQQRHGLRGGAAFAAAQGLRRRGEVSQEPDRKPLPRQGWSALVSRSGRRGAEESSGGAPLVR